MASRVPVPQPKTPWGRGLEAGFEFAIAVLLFTGLGYWLDGKLGSEPWLMLAGVAFGFAVGLNLILRALKRATESSANKNSPS